MAGLVKRVALVVAGGLALLALFGVGPLKAAAEIALAVLIVVVVLLV